MTETKTPTNPPKPPEKKMYYCGTCGCTIYENEIETHVCVADPGDNYCGGY